MNLNRALTLSLTGFSSLFLSTALAREPKPILPPYILQAHTVAVVIDPDAGINLHDPNANQTAQRDVEAALQKWNRFEVVLSPQSADLIIVLRKGLGKLATETVGDPRQNGRPGSVTQTPDAISIGAQHGPPPPGAPGTRTSTQSGDSSAHPQSEIGNTDDSFQVFEGRTAPSTDSAPAWTDRPPAWQWVRKNALHSHDVPAVDEFRKALAEAEKQAAQQQSKHL
jgi:hypothetical protein